MAIAPLPPARTGVLVLFASALLLFLGAYATLFSALLPPTGLSVLDALARDAHYMYFAVLLVPTTSYFVIANWVGWQYYRNS